MNNLISLYASGCNLGLQEIYNDDMENDGRNPETDSLSCLQYKKNLSALNVSGNSNLRWINYISDLNSNMREFHATGCTKLVGLAVKDIKNVILSATVWGIDDEYNIYLSTDTRIDYLNSSLDDDSDEFLALKDKIELKALRLDRKF